MKKAFLISLILAFVGSLSTAQSSNRPLSLESNSLSVSVLGGAFAPVNGKFDATRDITDVLETGPSLGVSLSYSLSPLLSLRGSYDFAYNNFDSKYRPTGKVPAFVAPMVTTDLVLKFGSVIKGNDILNPYCFSGTGLYLWKISEDGTCGQGKGNPMRSAKGTEWKECSFELHTGIGAEAYVHSNLSLFAEGQFRYVFSKDAQDFGNDFGNLLFFKISGGVTYYFSLDGGSK